MVDGNQLVPLAVDRLRPLTEGLLERTAAVAHVVAGAAERARSDEVVRDLCADLSD